MMVLRHLGSFRPDQSDPNCFLGEEIASGIRSYSSYGVSKKINAGIAMSKAVFNGSHIWRERELGTPTLLLSDALVTEIKKAGLKIPKHFPLKEV
jgi:phosphoenolpyruvate synthase/pyruvate phosphate dikinase